MFLNVGLNQNFNAYSLEKQDSRRHEGNKTVDEEKVWNIFEKERNSQPDDLDSIIRAVGLKPLNIYNTMAELKTKLGLKTYPNEIMLSQNHLKYLEKVQGML